MDTADTLDFGQIDLGDGIGFGRRTKTTNMRITSNVDIGVLFESRGFVDSEGNKISLLNEWVQYTRLIPVQHLPCPTFLAPEKDEQGSHLEW